jgi:hypothetical protein
MQSAGQLTESVTDGHGGCELWLSASSPVGKGA